MTEQQASLNPLAEEEKQQQTQQQQQAPSDLDERYYNRLKQEFLL